MSTIAFKVVFTNGLVTYIFFLEMRIATFFQESRLLFVSNLG